MRIELKESPATGLWQVTINGLPVLVAGDNYSPGSALLNALLENQKITGIEIVVEEAK